MNRTYDRMILFTRWPGMQWELGEYASLCESAKRIKSHKIRLRCQWKSQPYVTFEKNALWYYWATKSNFRWGQVCLNISGQTLQVYVSYTNTATRHCNSSEGCYRSTCFKIWDSLDDINRHISTALYIRGIDFKLFVYNISYNCTYIGHLESKECLRIQPAQLFNFSWWVMWCVQ